MLESLTGMLVVFGNADFGSFYGDCNWFSVSGFGTCRTPIDMGTFEIICKQLLWKLGILFNIGFRY